MRFAILSLCLLACAGPAAAQTQTTPTPAPLDQVYACAAITDSTQRLACYDQAVGRLQQAQRSGELVAVDRQQAQQIDREAFGFSLPSLPNLFRFGQHDQSEDGTTAEMNFVIERVNRRADSRATFVMTNGQVWNQTDDLRTTQIRTGANVRIYRAAMGTFLMSTGNGPAIRVRRSD